MALAAVICSALATVLLALLVLCVIYCKRQLLEKKPSGESPHLHSLVQHARRSISVEGEGAQRRSWKCISLISGEVYV